MKKAKYKKLLSILLAAAMVLVMMPSVAFAETGDSVPSETDVSGSCGETENDSVTWALTRNNNDDDNPTYTLTISGTGEMTANFDDVKVDGTKMMDIYGNAVNKIVIEEGVTYLSANLTRNTKNVEIEIPASVTGMNIAANKEVSGSLSTFGNNYYDYDSDKAEADVSGIAKITVADGNQFFEMKDGVLFSKDGKILYRYTNEADANYTVPDGVEIIAAKAFARSETLTGVTLNHGLLAIGENCFDKSVNLSGTMTIPETVKALGSSSFTQLPKLKEVVFEATDLSDYHTLRGDISAPETGIEKITLADGTTSIPGGIFTKLTKLETVIVPVSLEEIGTGAFSGCSALKSISLTADTKLTAIPASAFSGTSLESIVIPDSVTEIGNGAFNNCTALNTITISKNSELTKIGNNAICGTAITSFYMPSGVTSWGQYAFGGDRKLTAVDLTDVTGSVSFSANTCAFYNTNHADTLGAYQTRIYYFSDAEDISGDNSLKAALGSNSTLSIYAVTNGGTFNTVPTGNTALAEPAKCDYIFDGWYSDEACTADNKVTESTTLSTKTTYYAKWTACEHINTSYTADGAVLRKICADCGHVFSTATLAAPEDLIYDGSVKEAAVTILDGWEGADPVIAYSKGSETLDGAPTDAGTYTAKITAEGAEASLTFTVRKAAPAVSISADKASVSGSNTVHLTVGQSGLPAGAQVSVTCDNGITVAAGENGTYKADLPNKTQTYTFTVSYDGNKNYEPASATCVVSVTYKSVGSATTPTAPTVQKPVIEPNADVTTSLSTDGTALTIKANDGYEITDVTVNGVSKGAVTTLTGLKTGDKVVIKTQKLETPDDNAALIEAVKSTKLIARSAMSTAKGKKAVKVYWYAADGSDLDFDGYEVFRSLKRYSGFGTTPFFKTANEKYYNTAIKKGNKYYYKVRAYKVIDGEKVYTDWSTKAWRTVK